MADTVWASGLWADGFWADGLWSGGDAPAPTGRTPAGGVDIYRKPSRADEERDEDKKRLRELVERAVKGDPQPSDVRAAATAVVSASPEVLAAVEPEQLKDLVQEAKNIALAKARVAAIEQHAKAAERIGRLMQDDDRLIELLRRIGRIH